MRANCQFSKPFRIFVIFSLILSAFINITGSRRCYSCSTLLESDSNYDCLYNLTKAEDFSNIMYCPYYCTIRRQDYADVQGGINYLNRSCEESKVDGVVMNGYFITYVRSCRRDLCNSGDGLDSLKDIPEDEDDGLGLEMEPSMAVSLGLPLVPISLLHYSIFLSFLYFS